MPIPLPLEVTLYRRQPVVARDSSAPWMEVYQLFLEQVAAGWNVEYSDPIQGKLHTLPPAIAKAIPKVGGFSFLSSESNTLAVFRSHYSLSDEPVPV